MKEMCELRIFAAVGTLITAVIIGFMAAAYFGAATGPVTSIPETETPYGTIIGSEENPGNVIDAAQSLVSMDRNRQRGMQEQLDRLGGAP
ncbi:MAG: hypothetical protein LBR87_01155 [Synergistaceae bacterium]|jgi:hypothetical protein|nr:hypothetical protein [Synergistaceae bacterium]